MLQREPAAFADPQLAAMQAGLRYMTDSVPGITRKAAGKGFTYWNPDGTHIRDTETLARIRMLAIPPAWIDVWISPNPDGHLAATGRDARGRKQYRYNPEFIAVRDAAKFEHILNFAKALPALRRRVRRDMAKPGMPREKVLATVIYLLERTLSRVGNETYSKDNNSYGLTTLRNRHVRVSGAELHFLFTGKGGKKWRLSLKDRRVANVVRACQELPGQHLFEYMNGDSIQPVGSSDVNAYLQETTGQPITAKDFRTWFGTVEAAMALQAFHEAGSKPTKKNIREAIAQAADRLGNTITICRKCYVHPEILRAYEEGNYLLRLPSRRHGLKEEEERVLAFLKSRLRKSARKPPIAG